MKIVLLDGYTANSGDTSWASLEALGEFTVYDRSTPEETPARIKDADVVIVNKALLTADMIAQAPKLKYIGVLATGYNIVDLEAATARKIPVTNAAGYSTQSVAQHVFALILAFTNQIIRHHDKVREGAWVQSVDFTFRLPGITELAGKTMGIVGLGTIGQATAKLAQAFGMKVIAQNRSPRNMDGVEMVEIDELFERSDVVSLHCALTPETHHLINAQRLQQMKSSALLINTGRGPLIDEAALAEALATGELAGAGVDVLSSEPPAADNPLLSAPNCIITPHTAWGSAESRQRLIDIVADNLKAFQEGRLENLVNEVG